jgi:hypothetical protein
MTAKFDYSLPFSRIDFRKQPERYRIGRGEQGVLLVEPYKSEILPHWRFRTPELAAKSAAAILRLFRDYRARRDFVGMDMARKFLQMGYTRARRYANHRSGRKYAKGDGRSAGRRVLPRAPDAVKAQSAAIFHQAWRKTTADRTYQALLRRHRAAHEQKKGARRRLLYGPERVSRARPKSSSGC